MAALIVAFPQIPQLDELKTCRLNFVASKRGGIGQSDLNDIVRSVSSVVRQEVISKISDRFRTMPSVRANPAASSRSCPGVRMTTAMLRPSTRISSGSSTATSSGSAGSGFLPRCLTT